MSPVPVTTRIASYIDVLEDALGPSFRESFEVDRWATAAELLQRRDELLLAGWSGVPDDTHPPLIQDLALVEQAFDGAGGSPDRLFRVRRALDRGQSLPPHRVTLEEPAESWPLAWRPVLRRLTATSRPVTGSAAPAGSGLERLQLRLAGGEAGRIATDESLHWISAGSVHEAVQLLAAGMADAEGGLDHTVIYTSEPSHASQLEEAFLRLGGPALGAPRSPHGHPVHQVLPIAVELCWEPVDPQTLMDLLSLPGGPIPRSAARHLARGLAEFPGLGSRSWEKEWTRLETESPELAQKAAKWLHHRRENVGNPVHSGLVAERCAHVARWARGYAEALGREGKNPELANALFTAHSRAAALHHLVETYGGELSQPQLQRMLDDVRDAGGVFVPRPADAGGPLAVSNLADVPEWCRRLIWLGTGLEVEGRARWTRGQLLAIKTAGIDLDDGRRALRQQRLAERRGLLRVSQGLVVVSLPSDAERRPHPLWSRAVAAMDAEEDGPEPVAVAALLEPSGKIGPWTVRSEEVSVEPPQPPRHEWHLDPQLLSSPPSTSATEMEDRLACPLRWVLRRAARIRPSHAASLPNDFLLRGRFAHALLEDVFGGGDREVPEPDDAVRAVKDRFDERLPLDAAPLARPDRVADRRRFRSEIARATRVFVEALRAGGYRIVDMEAALDVELDGRPLYGRIDCLVKNDHGEGLIDFKYVYNHRGYWDWLREGTATQLAVYAFARGAGDSGQPLDSVAYLMLRQGRLYTPEGNPLAGASAHDVVDAAPAINVVWDRFTEALRKDDGWLSGTQPVPARPLQDPGVWPAGAEMVLDADGRGEASGRPPCRYCDYQIVCGARECP